MDARVAAATDHHVLDLFVPARWWVRGLQRAILKVGGDNQACSKQQVGRVGIDLEFLHLEE